MRQIVRLDESQLINTIKESVKALFEGGHLYGTDSGIRKMKKILFFVFLNVLSVVVWC